MVKCILYLNEKKSRKASMKKNEIDTQKSKELLYTADKYKGKGRKEIDDYSEYTHCR